MPNTENQDEVETELDGSDETEETDEAGEASDAESEETQEPTKKNKTNWKAMNKGFSHLKNENLELREKIKKLQSGDNELKIDKSDLALFLVENPEAKEQKQLVLDAMEKFSGISLEEAWKYVQATAPKESQTKTTMSVKFTASNPPKDISKLPEDEALKLPNAQFLKWARLVGKIK